MHLAMAQRGKTWARGQLLDPAGWAGGLLGESPGPGRVPPAGTVHLGSPTVALSLSPPFFPCECVCCFLSTSFWLELVSV